MLLAEDKHGGGKITMFFHLNLAFQIVGMSGQFVLHLTMSPRFL